MSKEGLGISVTVLSVSTTRHFVAYKIFVKKCHGKTSLETWRCRKVIL
jgi:hypothetical protein